MVQPNISCELLSVVFKENIMIVKGDWVVYNLKQKS